MTVANPFHWRHLPARAVPLQARLHDEALDFISIGSAIATSRLFSVHRFDLSRDVLLAPILQINQLSSSETQSQIDPFNHEIERVSSVAAGRALGDPACLVVVPDTSALYERPDLEAWRFGTFKALRIVLVPAVVEEIDRHKDGPESRRREMAAKLARQISDYRRRGRLADGVPLRTGYSRVSTDFGPANLDKLPDALRDGSNDNQLLAAGLHVAARFAQSPSAVVTRDVNLANKCEFLRLCALTLEDLVSEHPAAPRRVRPGAPSRCAKPETRS